MGNVIKIQTEEYLVFLNLFHVAAHLIKCKISQHSKLRIIKFYMDSKCLY